MKIRTTVEDLIQALETANIVKPKLKGSSDEAFLIASSGGKLYVHSHDGVRATRTELKFASLEGEGAFAFPSDKLPSLKYVEGWIELESGRDEKRHWVKYTTEGGALVDISSYDPANFNTLVGKLKDITEERTYLTVLLRDALKTVTGFAPKDPEKVKDNEQFNTLQIFDSSKPEWVKGDGIMLGADGVRAAYFACDALKGKGLGVHTEHFTYLTSFLAKCGPTVKVKFGEGMNFLIQLLPEEDGTFTEGAVLGWASHIKEYSQFKYYGTIEDKVVMMVPKAMIVKSLSHMKSLVPGDTKVRLILKDNFLNFKSNIGGNSLTSAPVGVALLPLDDGSPSVAGIEYNINVDNFLELFAHANGHEIELRIVLVPPNKSRKEPVAFFRTIDPFRLNAEGDIVIDLEGSYECRVTRCTPSAI